ncbi:MAG: leucine-rich repeat domain-containing protein, partial [archaeon]|nr:leucine-rich repeat domain-containing protein [archaeon]
MSKKLSSKKEELNFACPEEDCGRKFKTKELLDEHIKNRHKKVKEKENNESENNNEEKLSKLMEKINSLETSLKMEGNEMMEHFEITEEDIDEKKALESLDEEDEEEKEIIKKYNRKQEKIMEEDSEYSEEEEEIKPKENKIVLNKNTKEEEEKVIEITNELLGIDAPTKEEEIDPLNPSEHAEDIYSELKEINLSNKKIYSFLSKQKVDFSEFTGVTKINLSHNFISYSYDIQHFINLIEVDISNNRITDLLFCEKLPNLEKLNASNNKINSVTSLNKCRKMKALDISNNNLIYKESTLRTFQNLRQLEDLKISPNPFLNEILGYKQLFIYKFSALIYFDGEQLTDLDKDIAKRFTLENNPINAELLDKGKFRPMSGKEGGVTRNILGRKINKAGTEDNKDLDNKEIKEEDEIEDKEEINNMFNKTQNVFKFGNTVITRIGHIKNEENQNESTLNESNDLNDSQNKLRKKVLPQIKNENPEVAFLKKENLKLQTQIENQQKEIELLKLQIENLTVLNKEYELNITQLKQIKQEDFIKEQQILKIKREKEDDEKSKLKQELETWKREYYELFDKTYNNQSNSGRGIREGILGSNMYGKKPSQNINSLSANFTRPMSATLRTNISSEFDKIAENIRIMKRKNSLDDSLGNISGEDEKEENLKEDKEESEE